MKNRAFAGILFAYLVIFLTRTSFAASTGINGTNLNYYSPNMDGQGAFSLEAPGGLNGGEIYFAVSQMAAYQNIFSVNIDGVNTDIIESLLASHLSGAIGINDRVTLGFDMPYYASLKGENFDSLQDFSTRTFGDARLNLKFELLSESANQPGISIKLLSDFPTGEETLFVGNQHIVPGFDLIIGKNLKYVNLMGNIGMRFPWQQSILGVPDDDRVTYGLGVAVPFLFIDPNFSFVSEIHGHLQYANPSTFTAPVEFIAGLKKEFKNGLAILAGAGGATNNALGNPRIRGVLGLSYDFNPFRKKEDVSFRETAVRQPEVTTPTITAEEYGAAAISEQTNRRYTRVFETTLTSSPAELMNLVHYLKDSHQSLVALIQVNCPAANPVLEKQAIEQSESIRSFLIQNGGLKPSQVSFSSDSWNQSATDYQIKITLLTEQH